MTTIINFEYYTSSSNYLNKSEDTRTNGIVATRGNQPSLNRRSAFIFTDEKGKFDACQTPTNTRNYSNAVAIIQRGGNCTFNVKVARAKQYGAAGDFIDDISLFP